MYELAAVSCTESQADLQPDMWQLMRSAYLEAELQRRLFEIFGGRFKESILGRETESIVHYTWPGSSIKQPIPNYLIDTIAPC